MQAWLHVNNHANNQRLHFVMKTSPGTAPSGSWAPLGMRQLEKPGVFTGSSSSQRRFQFITKEEAEVGILGVN